MDVASIETPSTSVLWRQVLEDRLRKGEHPLDAETQAEPARVGGGTITATLPACAPANQLLASQDSRWGTIFLPVPLMEVWFAHATFLGCSCHICFGRAFSGTTIYIVTEVTSGGDIHQR